MPDDNASAEAAIRALIAAWAKAAQDKDLDSVVAHHTADILMFDVPPPAAVRGLAAYRDTWPNFFRWQREADGVFEITSLDVTAGDSVAFATALLRCASKQHLARDDTPSLRLTVGLRKEAGTWMVAHEHHSFPATGA